MFLLIGPVILPDSRLVIVSVLKDHTTYIQLERSKEAYTKGVNNTKLTDPHTVVKGTHLETASSFSQCWLVVVKTH